MVIQDLFASMDERCDQIIHCNDKSDEDECALIVFEKSYNKLVSPFTVDYDEDGDEEIVPVKVFVSTSLRRTFFGIFQFQYAGHGRTLNFIGRILGDSFRFILDKPEKEK